MKLFPALAVVAVLVSGAVGAKILSDAKVGDRTRAGILVNTGQFIDPDGKLTVFGARPVDLVLSDDGRTAYLKENAGITIVETTSGKILQRLSLPGGASMTGLVLSEDGKRLYSSNSGDSIHEVDVANSPAKVLRSFKIASPKVGGNPYPCGLVVSGDRLFAALNRSNQVAEISLESGKVLRTIDVAPAPFSVEIDSDRDELWVSSWGMTPSTNGRRADSSGTAVSVDARGIGNGGLLSQIDLKSGTVAKTAKVGLQPCELSIQKSKVYVACANSDTLMSVDRDSGKAKVEFKTTVGAAPSSVEVLSDGSIALACGGSNELVVLDKSTHKPIETYKSAWYPIAVRSRAETLFVASAKGLGSRKIDLQEGKFDSIAETEKFATKLSPDEVKEKGVYQFTGALSAIPRSADQNRSPQQLPKSLPPRSDVEPVPVPERVGEPSVFKHVIYVLKENRTYDQVFGDIPDGDGDPSLCIYGEKITPNHHAIAKDFVLLDNYYCNGVLSADGHSWSTEGNATTQFERSFGGWTRSYPFGDDPLAISSTGHIWDSVLDKGLSFKNYGEYNYTEPAKGEKHTEILRDFQSGQRKISFKYKIGIDRLRMYSDPECPGWNMEIPDVLRASYFLRDLKSAEKSGKLPNFNFVYLPQDHTSGGGAGVPHPTAHMADNDLALGQIVDAVSKSRFWKETVIFVIEDDPQAGFDHVDGHRSICLVISPYTVRQQVVSKFYNQGSVLKTIRHILGLQPVTRFEKIAPLMTDCFTRTADMRPYTVLPNNVPLDLMNPSNSTVRALNLAKPDQVDEDVFNRQLWASAKADAKYPKQLTGAHGSGLRAKGLQLDGGVVEED
ncbi:MAG TPA: alkaline phosphatase family protein [Fimbriimonas sp.]|nr:alkaline phosphatase family protein [Fimbriimonas sp.]